MISFSFFLFAESVELCLNKDINYSQSLILITFDSGSNAYSNRIPSYFYFTTTHKQQFTSNISDGKFVFVNVIPENHTSWHGGALDHTLKDTGGYMYLVNMIENGSQIFNSIVNDLCIGLRYEFSAYMANIVQKKIPPFNSKPNIRLELRTTTAEKQLLAQLTTGEISEYDNMSWSKYGLSFIASTTSVVLLMISNVGGNSGNEVAIDDIELRLCSSAHFDFQLPG